MQKKLIGQGVGEKNVVTRRQKDASGPIAAIYYNNEYTFKKHIPPAKKNGQGDDYRWESAGAERGLSEEANAQRTEEHEHTVG